MQIRELFAPVSEVSADKTINNIKVAILMALFMGYLLKILFVILV